MRETEQESREEKETKLENKKERKRESVYKQWSHQKWNGTVGILESEVTCSYIREPNYSSTLAYLPAQH